LKKNEKEEESLPCRRLLLRWTSAKGWPPRNDYPIFPASVCSLFLCLVCLSVSVFLFFCSFPLGFSLYTLCSLFLLPFVLFSFPSPSPLVCSPARFFFSLFRSTLPRSPCISLLQCPVPGAVAAKDGALELLWRRSITVSPFVSLFSVFF